MKNTTSQSDRVGMFYRALSDDEQSVIYQIKQHGQEFIDLIDGLGNSPETAHAKARIEEAVMWAVKHVTS